MSLVCNARHYAQNFAITADGAAAARDLAAGDPVGVFVYWEWHDQLPVSASSLAPAVRHAPAAAASCVLAGRAPGTNVQLLVARRPLARGARLTIDYWRLPYWVWWPPAAVPRALCRPAVYRLSTEGVVHGVGVVAAVPLGPGAVVGTVIERRYWWLVPVITRDLGRYINHSTRPNARMEWRGCAGVLVVRRVLNAGDELTIDYTTMPGYCAGPEPSFVH